MFDTVDYVWTVQDDEGKFHLVILFLLKRGRRVIEIQKSLPKYNTESRAGDVCRFPELKKIFLGTLWQKEFIDNQERRKIVSYPFSLHLEIIISYYSHDINTNLWV